MDSVHHSDALDLCNSLAPQSVDMILADLPYGTTACSWDEIIPFAPMWAAFKRVIKPRGAIVLTASQPFTSRLVMSNIDQFKYEWIWVKNRGTNFLVTQFMPMKEHESVLVFGGQSTSYFPVNIPRSEKGQSRAKGAYNPYEKSRREAYSGFKDTFRNRPDPLLRVPSSVLFYNDEHGYHPTQKPVDLFAYLIRTYTQPGELVLDPTCGSGTTAIAARQTGRHYIVGDSAAEYVAVTRQRLAQPYTLPLPLEDVPQVKPQQLGLAI